MRFKKVLLSFAIFLLLCSMLSSSQLGLGIIIGAPTGFSLKFWQTKKTALDLALAWNFDKYFHIHGDYLYHFPLRLEGVSPSTLCTYLGIGARLKFKSNERDENKSLLGIRGVGGLEFLPKGVPLDVFLEIAPVMNIVEETKLDIEGGIGIRYTFNL
ncbi:MAG: hypothetical protein E3J87_01985 [Candidatus Cloacimonadota bacterium]|nr:MAG: hypothetical protein E3J87_01985 [Candidatus Cloacimonadota bacterium]